MCITSMRAERERKTQEKKSETHTVSDSKTAKHRKVKPPTETAISTDQINVYLTITERHHTSKPNGAFYKCLWRQFKARKVRYLNFSCCCCITLSLFLGRCSCITRALCVFNSSSSSVFAVCSHC